MAAPIYSPQCPGSYILPIPVRSGLEIIVNGKVHHKKKEFEINLLSGGNIALHINFRWDKEKTVVLNSKLNNAWGAELKHVNDLHHDQSFELHIRVYPGHFHITSNGVVLGDFPHRTAYEMIQAISLNGNVDISNIHFQQLSS